MKAIVRERYGGPDALQFAEIEKPNPKDNEVLIKVCAASVNPIDLFAMRGAPLLRRLSTPKQKVLGCDIAGRVEAAGKNVRQFQAGDEVFGVTGFGGGGFAEYVCAMEDKLERKPGRLSFEEAAAVPIAAITALQGLRDKGLIQKGQKVVVEGASGGVGTFAVQIAKSFGVEVTAVCSTRNVEAARAIGGDYVIDYTREDFTKSGLRYDLIFAANAHHSILEYRRTLKPGGICVVAGGGMGQVFQALLLGPVVSRIGSKKICCFLAKINQNDLDFLKELMETGKVVPVIDRRYSLREAGDALRYLEEHHARGKVVLSAEG